MTDIIRILTDPPSPVAISLGRGDEQEMTC